MPGPVLKQDKQVITLKAQEICEACSGELLSGSGTLPVESVSTDTRESLEGKLFIALKGEHFDGGDFVEEALAGGAVGVVAETAAALRCVAARAGSDGDAPVIIAVDDAGEALKKVAALVATRSGARIVGITGSTGKTSTKDILYGLLKDQVKAVAGRASFNNEVGVPLTLLAADAGTQVIVVEMGMRSPDDVRELTGVAAPDIAIITNIGPAHLEFAGSLENIAAGKAEIARGLKPGGRLIVPYGEKLLEPHLGKLDVETFTFGFDPAADVHPAGGERLEDGRLSSTISCFGHEIDVSFDFAARHHLLNAMAAMAAYYLLELPLDAIAAAARSVHLPGMRGELLKLRGGGTLINDCYNANPLSMRLSLEHLASVGAGRRTVAVLGDMGELGPASAAYHREVGREVAGLGIDCLIAVGEMAAGYIEGAGGAGKAGEGAGGSGSTTRGATECHYFADREAAIRGVASLLEPGDVVLVKASRFLQLEKLSRALTETGNAGNADGGG